LESQAPLPNGNGAAGSTRGSPSIIPSEQDVYLLLDDFGYGRVWRETSEENMSREAVIRLLLENQYSHPVLIVALNTPEGWSRDVTCEIATELRQRIADTDDVASAVGEFLEAAVNPETIRARDETSNTMPARVTLRKMRSIKVNQYDLRVAPATN
jgi:hypothetical protein